MTIYSLAGMHYAIQMKKDGGGYIAIGKSVPDAIVNCLKRMNYGK